jgi:hypothetical protein
VTTPPGSGANRNGASGRVGVMVDHVAQGAHDGHGDAQVKTPQASNFRR